MPVFSGDLPVIVAANNIQEIQAAVAWADAEDLKLIIMGGADAWRVTDLLVAHHIPVIVTGTHRLPSRRWEDFDTPFTLPAKLYEAGVKFCISSGMSWGGTPTAASTRNLPYHAGTAAAYGLPALEALKAVTVYPAQILGFADRAGSLAEGMDATLIITDGDPLEIPTHVERMFIEGRDIDLTSRHTMLYEKYRTKYSQP
jgi:imidazolonepropionase-like amidohydrolase